MTVPSLTELFELNVLFSRQQNIIQTYKIGNAGWYMEI